MKIRRLDATFGNLHRKSISFGPGLNIVKGNNESGKSTWCAFIKAMLYGIDTREKAKAGFIPDKERFMPWSGDKMHGRMELEWNGKEYSIEREPNKTGVLSSATVCDLQTSQEIAGVEAPGEKLLGVKKEVFQRSTFIGQANIKIDNDKNGELEKRIVSMSSSGEEDYSYAKVEKILRDWKNHRRHNTTGAGPKLEKSIEEKKEALTKMRRDANALTELHAEIEALDGAVKEYENKIRAWDIISAREANEIEEKVREELEKAEKAYNTALENAKINGVMPTEDYCNKLSEKYQEYIESREKYTKKIEAQSRAEKLLRMAEEECNVKGDIKKDIAYAKALEEKIKKIKVPIYAYFLAVAGVVCAVTLNPICIAIGTVAVIGGIILAILNEKKKKKANKELEEKLCEYGVKSYSELLEVNDAFEEKTKAYNTAREELERVREEVSFADNFCVQAGRELVREMSKISLDATEEDAPKMISRMRDAVSSVEVAKLTLKSAQGRAELVLNKKDTAQVHDNGQQVETPEISKAELQAKCTQAKNLKHTYELKASEYRANINNLGGIVDTQAKIDTEEQELERVNFQESAIKLALEELSNANGEIQRRFAPELQAKTAEIFKFLTGGRFDIVEIRAPQMELAVREEYASPAREVLSLSQGTVDELYLAMRLALSQVITEEGETPIILDDAFVNFDDGRMARALDYLAELSKTRQVIIFTCHTREEKYLKKADGVSVIEL